MFKLTKGVLPCTFLGHEMWKALGKTEKEEWRRKAREENEKYLFFLNEWVAAGCPSTGSVQPNQTKPNRRGKEDIRLPKELFKSKTMVEESESDNECCGS